MLDENKLKGLLNELEYSKNEDDVLDNLKKIVKAFEPHIYNPILNSNSYYKSLILDVKALVLNDIEISISDIRNEIKSINDSLNDPAKKNWYSDLNKLKQDCVSLLFELSERKSQIEKIK